LTPWELLVIDHEPENEALGGEDTAMVMVDFLGVDGIVSPAGGHVSSVQREPPMPQAMSLAAALLMVRAPLVPLSMPVVER
jgi:hypothetical protein